MPREARWFIRTSLVCMVLTGAAGTLMWTWDPLFGDPPPAWFRPLHLHLGTVGWLVNMVLGVALWMFPMPRGAFLEGRPRYSPTVVVAAYSAINGGLLLRFLSEPFYMIPLMIGSGILQTAGMALAVVALWPRVRAIHVVPGSPP